MVVMPLYGKKDLNALSQELRDLGMQHWGLLPYQLCSKLTMSYAATSKTNG